jgi:POT family proton-dependent oligopeptide transporter
MGTLARLKQHPRGFWFVFWGELAERASFYGMRTLLTLYLVDVLHFTRNQSGQTAQFFVATCYILPLLGGFVADRYLGKFKTILYFSFPYIMGHIILGNIQNPVWLWVALLLLAMGSGSVKPNTSTLMGLIYEKENKTHLLTEAFSYFYAAINVGAALTSLSLPFLRDKYGYQFAFIFPTVFMVIAFAIFAMGKKYYPEEHPTQRPTKTPAQKAEERATLARIGGIFTLIVAFWLVYDQYSSTWVFLARDHMDLRLWPFNITLAADQIQGLNPVFILIYTPLFIGLWEYLKKATGKPVPATRKMMFGFILCTLCTLIMSAAGYLSHDGKVSVWYQVIATGVITLAELCIVVVGLEFAYSVASESTKSTVTAAFWITVFVGDFLGGIAAGFYEQTDPAIFFGAQAALVAVCTVIFYFVSRKFETSERESLAASVASSS